MKEIALILFLSYFPPLFATDAIREQAVVEEIEDSLVEGEIVWLNGKTQFLALLTDSATKKSRGAVVMLHGMGKNPNTYDVIRPLRTRLPEHGWITLSLQMPLREIGVEIEDYFPLIPEASPRIDSAIDYLKKKNIETIILIGHSLGAVMGLNYLANKSDPVIKAAVLVSLPVFTPTTPETQIIRNLGKIPLPVLDIYGSRDLTLVRNTASKRRIAMKNNKKFRQIILEGSDHNFSRSDERLVKRIYSWITLVNP